MALKNAPWSGSSVGQSIIPICQGCSYKHRDALVKLRPSPIKDRTTIHFIRKGKKAGDHDSGPILDQIPFSPVIFLPQSMKLLSMMNLN